MGWLKKAPNRAAEAEKLFAEYFPRLWPRMASTLVLLCGSHVDIENLVQEAFIRLYERLLKDPKSVKDAYVVRIAVNVALDHMRRMSAKEASLEDYTVPHWERIAEHDGYQEAMELLDLMQLLDPLDLIRRQIVVLTVVYAMKPREIALVLGIKPGTVTKYRGEALKLISPPTETYEPATPMASRALHGGKA